MNHRHHRKTSFEAPVRLAIRVYSNGVLQSVERIERTMDELSRMLPRLAEQHGEAMSLVPGHVEIEFLDEPDVEQRFFRLGTDPRHMIKPMEADLMNPASVLRMWGKR